MKSILQLTTYDIEKPDHGGKLRSHYIRRQLRQMFEVVTLSFEWGEREEVSSSHIVLNKNHWDELGLDGMLSDWGIWRYLEHFHTSYDNVCRLVREYKPEAILMEQPFLWRLVKQLFLDDVIAKQTRIVYSSHNVEVDMKRQIYRRLYSPEQAEHFTSLVDQCEQGVIKACVGAIAASQADCDYIRQIAPHKEIQVCINGHTKPIIDEQSPLAKWAALFNPHGKNWVYVGSWHQPNVDGLRRLLDNIPCGLSSKEVGIWVLGSAGNAIQALGGFDETVCPWLHIVGPVSADDINTAILLSSGVFLPIWEGGGSNLKTAQALLSEKCILGSTFAFRSFEKYMTEPGVFLTESPEGLAQLIIKTVPQSVYQRSEAVSQLEWEAILKGIPEFMNRIVARDNMWAPE